MTERRLAAGYFYPLDVARALSSTDGLAYGAECAAEALAAPHSARNLSSARTVRVLERQRELVANAERAALERPRHQRPARLSPSRANPARALPEPPPSLRPRAGATRGLEGDGNAGDARNEPGSGARPGLAGSRPASHGPP